MTSSFRLQNIQQKYVDVSFWFYNTIIINWIKTRSHKMYEIKSLKRKKKIQGKIPKNGSFEDRENGKWATNLQYFQNEQINLD